MEIDEIESTDCISNKACHVRFREQRLLLTAGGAPHRLNQPTVYEVVMQWHFRTNSALTCNCNYLGK